ncbi:MAG: PAS domain S-box protein [Elusimicrobia bacterium]|nr:PAS domain S-box protein [Elusimicrobiota bacterium]
MGFPIPPASEPFEAIVAQAPLIIFGIDAQGRFTFSTGRGLATLGLSPGEAVGRSALEFYQDSPGVLADLSRALQGEDFSSVVPIGELWWETSYHPVFTAAGRLKAVVGLALDVTSRHRVEAELIQSERRFRTVIDTMQEGFYLTDREGKRLFANKALARIYGRQNPSDLLGQSFLDRVAPHMREGIKARFQEAMRTGVFPERVEIEFLRDDGSRGLMELDPTPVYDDGKLAGACGVARDVTERRKAEETLRLTQFAVDRCSMPIYWVARDAHLEYVNDAACTSLGYTREEMLRLSIHDMDPDLPASRWQEHWEKSKREGILRIETKLRAKDGRIFPVEVTINHMEFGGKEYHFSFVHDISERREAEARIRQSQEMLRLVLDLIPQRVFWKDRQSRYLGCNQAFLKDAGLSDLAQILGQDDFQMSWKESARRHRADDEEVMSSGRPKLGYEEAQAKPDGTQAWLRTSKLPLKDAEGRIIGVLGTSEDISARKDAERALRMMHFAMEHTSDAVMWAEPSGRVRYANPAACRHLGYSGEAILKMTMADIDADHDPRAWEAQWRRLRQEGYLKFEARQRAQDGRVIPVEISVNHVQFEGEEFSVSFTRDISERRQAEGERARLLEFEKKARAEAEASSLAKDEFLAIVSHELRTPMTAILGWNWLLRSGDLSPVERDRAMEVIDRNMQLQKQIIEDLLDISSLARKQLTLRRQIVDLGGVVAEAGAELKSAAQAKSLRLDCAPVLGLTVEADPQRLRQIFWNLISNAVKFTPDGGTVTVQLSQESSAAVVSVEDSGPGISPDFYPHLFDLFQQQEDSLTRMHRGLGLGLAIAKRLVDLHGGTVSVAPPAPGRGARFTVSLPLAAAPRAAAPDRPAAAPEAGPPIRRLLQGVRILVVEDDDDTRGMLISALSYCGAETRGAATAAEGFALFTRDGADVLISDIAMSGEDGYGLLRRIRALKPEQGGQVPAAALTAYASSEDRTKALRAGFQICLPKPVDPAELVTVVNTLTQKPGA